MPGVYIINEHYTTPFSGKYFTAASRASNCPKLKRSLATIDHEASGWMSTKYWAALWFCSSTLPKLFMSKNGPGGRERFHSDHRFPQSSFNKGDKLYISVKFSTVKVGSARIQKPNVLANSCVYASLCIANCRVCLQFYCL